MTYDIEIDWVNGWYHSHIKQTLVQLKRSSRTESNKCEINIRKNRIKQERNTTKNCFIRATFYWFNCVEIGNDLLPIGIRGSNKLLRCCAVNSIMPSSLQHLAILSAVSAHNGFNKSRTVFYHQPTNHTNYDDNMNFQNVNVFVGG